MQIFRKIANELNIRLDQATDTVKLIDSGCSVPFIARYRKEVTGDLDDQTIRLLAEKLEHYRSLEARKEDVRRLIGEQGFLTDAISDAIDSCTAINEIEDIYRPFRPKRRTRAMIAVQKGLEGFANAVLEGVSSAQELERLAHKYIDPDKIGRASCRERV